MKNILLWLVYFPFALAVELFCYLTNPIAALLTYREARHDWVKRLGRYEVLQRDYLWLSWWQTHDNAADEWWYGKYNQDHWFDFAKNWTQHDYDNSWFIRYYCRVIWLYRNNAYGWLYALFSRRKELLGTIKFYGKEYSGAWLQYKSFTKSFQLEIHADASATFYALSMVAALYWWWGSESLATPWIAVALVGLGYFLQHRYISVNIGWKAHRSTDRLLYANRIIGLRKYPE